jgi:hypothetical protein
MSRPIIRIHDIATDKIIDREMTVAEFKEYEEAQALQATLDAEKAAKAELRKQTLAALGL